MSSLFRSEVMTLCQLFIQSEAAYGCVAELGELGLVQFRDLNSNVNAFQRKFVNEVRRCNEMERRLRYVEKETKKDGIPMLDSIDRMDAPQPREIIDLEATFEKLENELREVNLNTEALKKNYLELTELKHILRKTQVFFDEKKVSKRLERVALFEREFVSLTPIRSRLSFVAGVVLRERLPAFERMLWRACHGNIFLRQAIIDSPLEDPTSGDKVYKSVFIIFFQGDQLKIRVKKICDGFRATLYPCPETPAERREMSMDVMTRLEDLNTVLGQTQDHRHRVLSAAAKNLKSWFVKVRKIKAIYHTLNSFNLDVTQKCLIAECWVAVADTEIIHAALRRGTERSGSTVSPIMNRMETAESPPTYNRTNKFTRGFQNLIDSYGMANYREINPAPYTIVTFPFLFAIMFGDMGHGAILTIFALWMIYKEKPLAAKKSENEIWQIFFSGRYVIFMMGIFSIYVGLIYNDIFSKSLNLFGSRWRITYDSSTVISNLKLQLDPGNETYLQSPYPFGIDPIWQISKNKIIFMNSYKMKISIIFGVAHMIFGVMMSFFNHRYFRDRVSVIMEFIPQMIFLVFLFFYMVLLMFIKWFKYSADNEPPDSEGCAPSILIIFINMVLFKGPPTPQEACEPYLYTGEPFIERLLVIIALLCIPWMFLGKPIYIMNERKRHVHGLKPLNPEQIGDNADIGLRSRPEPDDEEDGVDGRDHEDEDISEIFIHQAIHTIEYVLGCVSHTASYLRLWALSLAHAQLAEVLWQMILSRALRLPGFKATILLVPLFAFWAALTIAILILMEGLSAFLHTLRLHWVEFQSKFYTGAGYGFQPFSFETILDAANQAANED